jgi:hypothetical protein
LELNQKELDFENFKQQLSKITDCSMISQKGPLVNNNTDWSWPSVPQYDPRMAPLKPLTSADITALTTANLTALTTSNISSYHGLLGLSPGIPGAGTSNTAIGSYTVGAGTPYTKPWQTTNLVTPGPGVTNTGSTVIDLNGPNADIKINGVSLIEKIDAIAERLTLLVPNPKIESEWDQLKALGDEYRALEAKLIEQGKMWDKLKSMPKPEL